MSDFHYVGSELDLFAEARNWKAYWSRRIGSFVRGDVLEVGAGIGSNTELMRHLPQWAAAVYPAIEPLFQDAAMGALPTLRAASDPAVLGGQFYGPGGFTQTRGYPKIVASSRKSHDIDRQRRLWAVSEELTGVTYPVD